MKCSSTCRFHTAARRPRNQTSGSLVRSTCGDRVLPALAALTILLAGLYPVSAAYQTTVTADFSGNTGAFDKTKLLNTARGGQGIIGDLSWMPKFNQPMADVGVREFRIDWLFSDWPYYVISRNGSGQLTYDFSKLDQVIVPMANAGIKPIMCMTYLPTALGYVNGPGGTNYMPTNMVEYKAAIKTYVEHYLSLGYSGWAWESHNEPEWFTTLTATQCYQMYKVFAEAVKEADATARVGGFGATGTAWAPYLNIFMDLYKADVTAGTAPPMDFFSIHQYYGDDFAEVSFAENAFWSRGLNPPALYLTEWNNGFGTNALQGNAGVTGGGYDTTTNAAYVAMKLNSALSYYWLRNLSFWNFADTDASKPFSGDLGMFTVDGHRKAAANVFWMFNQLEPNTCPVTVTGTGAASKRVYALPTRNWSTGSGGIVLWNYQTTAVDVSVTLSNLPFASLSKNIRLNRWLVDATHGNYYYDYLNGATNSFPGPNENAALVESTVLSPTNRISRGEYLPPCSVVLITLDATSDPVLGGKFSGTAYGNSPFWSNDPQYGFDKVFDGDNTTFYNYINASNGYAGLDLGSTQIVTRVRFVARSGFDRMVGGRFQGSLTSGTSGMVDLYTITNTPPAGWNEVSLSAGKYRYLRYLGSPTSLGEIAELEFYGADAVPPTLTTFTNSIFQNTPVGTVVGTVLMSDADNYQVPLTASIVGGNPGGAFALDPLTGEISVATPLSAPATVDLQIVVSDNLPGGALTNTGTVRIQVITNATGLVPGGAQYSLFYNNGFSGSLSNLTNSARWPNNPDAELIRPNFEGINNTADSFGATLRAYLLPPASGSYTFWVAGDDTAELWLGTSTNPASISRICVATNWTGPREWTKFTGQQSAPVSLTAGQAYYLEARMKESGGGDNLAAAWKGPATSNQTNLIAGPYLSPFVQNYAPHASGFSGSVRQDAVAGTAVGTVTVKDANGGDAHSFAITGGNGAGIFSVDASGVVRVASSAALLAAAPGTNLLQVTVTDSGTPPLNSVTNATVLVLASNALPAGLVREIWNGLPSASLILFTNADAYPNLPDTLETMTNFSSVQNIGDNFGSRIRAYVTPAQTGSYRFFLASDDNSILLLGTNDSVASAALAASVTGSTVPNAWNTYTSQVSTARSLVAGQRYYVEVLHKDSTGADFVQLGWSGPGLTGTNVIGASVLTPYDINAAPTTRNESLRVARAATNGTAVGSVIGVTTALDPVIFVITGGNTGGVFGIDPDTGLLTVVDNTSLTNLTLTNFTLTVTVQDSGIGGRYPLRAATATVTVKVINGSDPSLWSWLKFDETSGSTAADSSGSGNTGLLLSGASFAVGWSSNALTLDGVDDYARYPNNVVSELHDMTIAAWVRMEAGPVGARIVDLGASGLNRYLYLSPRSGAATLRFGITTNGSTWEQQLNAPAFPTNVWKHVAITLAGSTGLLYVDGQPVATNANITLDPSDLGSTTLNYIGRSQFVADPRLKGKIDDLRLYNRALTQPDIANLMIALPSVPDGLSAAAGNQVVSLSWNAVPNATSYNLGRNTDGSGSYATIANLVATNWADFAVQNGETYFYVVTALNAGGAGGASMQVSATPTAPQLSVALGSSQLTISWPAWAGDHSLYSATNLVPPVSWELVTNQPALVGTNLSVTLPAVTTGNLFLRLMR